jgi:hypothetical protein
MLYPQSSGAKSDTPLDLNTALRPIYSVLAAHQQQPDRHQAAV